MTHRRIAVVREEFEFNLREASKNGWGVNCRDRWTEFTEYQSDDRPTSAQALGMCHGCPMLELCRELALVTKADGMVMGGKVWIEGKPQVS